MPDCNVAILVLNWNNSSDTRACLASLSDLDYPAYRIIVIDNGSTDDSVAAIRRSYPSVEILETGANLGYAGGNNFGIRHVLAPGVDLVCILNNDVVVSAGFLSPLVAALQDDPAAGLATPLIAETPATEQVWAVGCQVDRRTGAVARRGAGQRMATIQSASPLQVDAVSGAAMLVKRDVLEHVGLLDEAYYLYYEEIDWSLRTQEAGYRILAVPESVVWHKVSATLGPSSPAIDYYMLRNHLRLIARHWPQPAGAYLLARVTLRNLMTIAAYTVKSHHGQRLPNRNARLRALRDAATGRWGPMG